MNSYFLIRRLRGPAILLLIGSLALLHQMGIIARPWHLFWPLLLILLGVLLLAERAALSAEGYPIFPWSPWHGTPPGPYPGAPSPGATQGPSGFAENPGTAIVPSPTHDFNDREGEQR
jgi:hypothetical protein